MSVSIYRGFLCVFFLQFYQVVVHIVVVRKTLARKQADFGPFILHSQNVSDDRAGELGPIQGINRYDSKLIIPNEYATGVL